MKSTYSLPTLYGKDTRGNEREWKVSVKGNTVTKVHGLVTGKKVTSARTFEGVNVGRKNETSPEEQAKREAERDWVKQLQKSYFPKDPEGIKMAEKLTDHKKQQGNANLGVSDAIRGVQGAKRRNLDRDNLTATGFESETMPMLCEKWEDHQRCYKYFDESNFYIQPKLDGVRALAQIVRCPNGEFRAAITSRTGKQYPWFAKLREEIKLLLETSGEPIVLDGEIYTQTFYAKSVLVGKTNKFVEADEELPVKARFDCISSMGKVARSEPHPLEGQLCYHIFDIAIPDLTFEERLEIVESLKRIANDLALTQIKFVPCERLESFKDIKEAHDRYSEQSYEGVIVRAASSVYLTNGKRSREIRKYKQFSDEEFEIVGVDCDEGAGEEYFTWVCQVGDQTFGAKPMGTREQRISWYQNSDDYIGKMLTVRYQEKTEYGVPRFPRGVAIRDYE